MNPTFCHILSENFAKYIVNGPDQIKDCYDFMGIEGSELCYEGLGVSRAHGALFCDRPWEACSNVLYCALVMGCHDCFGCCGLKKKRYCVLNKEYMKEEYEELVPRIIAHMRDTEEWGEFFPPSISPMSYNETVAQEFYPLTKAQVQMKGWQWSDIADDIPEVTRVIAASKLPQIIDDIPNDILNWAIMCEATKRPFKIIKQELEFYRQMKLPVPHVHPDERHRRRMALRNPRKLWTRTCDKCGKEMQTTYSPERPERVYCEECYLKEVY